MNIKYDKYIDAVYFAIKKAKVFKTIELKDNMTVDLDKTGKIVGIEILNYSEYQSPKSLKNNVKSGIPFSVVESLPILL